MVEFLVNFGTIYTIWNSITALNVCHSHTQTHIHTVSQCRVELYCFLIHRKWLSSKYKFTAYNSHMCFADLVCLSNLSVNDSITHRRVACLLTQLKWLLRLTSWRLNISPWYKTMSPNNTVLISTKHAQLTLEQIWVTKKFLSLVCEVKVQSKLADPTLFVKKINKTSNVVIVLFYLYYTTTIHIIFKVKTGFNWSF